MIHAIVYYRVLWRQYSFVVMIWAGPFGFTRFWQGHIGEHVRDRWIRQLFNWSIAVLYLFVLILLLLNIKELLLFDDSLAHVPFIAFHLRHNSLGVSLEFWPFVSTHLALTCKYGGMVESEAGLAFVDEG